MPFSIERIAAWRSSLAIDGWPLRRFIADYPRGKAGGRYVEASLPALPFGGASFDLALSPHLPFFYGEHLDMAFHIRPSEGMLHVATEVRCFPLLQIGGKSSPHVAGVVEAFRSLGANATVEPVEYEFRQGGSRMLRL